MNKKGLYISILFISFIAVVVGFKSINLLDNKATKKDINKENQENLISAEQNNKNKKLKKWKDKQIENYKHGTNLNFTSGEVVKLNLEAKEKRLELISGVKTKMNTYNNNSKEPLIIRVNKGDKLVVNFKNSLDESTTIHWHGIRVPNSEDGVPGITQKPIKPGETYTYEFVVNDPGNFLFHPHKNHLEQIGRGLYGMIIVEREKEYNYDKDLAWVLKDYRVGRDGKLTNDFGNMRDAVHGGRMGNLITINNILNKQQKINPGDTIRLRLANMSNARTYKLDLSEFNAKLISTDASLIKNPKKISKLEISPGERYGLEINFGKKIKNIPLMNTNTRKPYKLATFKIRGKDKKDSKIKTPEGNIPDWRNTKYKKPDVVIDLGGMGVMGGDKRMIGGQRGWTINDGIYPETDKPIHLKKGKMYIVRMVNNSKRKHPMHLHGDFFQVISVNGIKGQNIGFKDTVNVKASSYIDVAIIPTNRGKWAFHCHILGHSDLGMFTEVIVD